MKYHLSIEKLIFIFRNSMSAPALVLKHLIYTDLFTPRAVLKYLPIIDPLNW